jgi:uncharacterized DUF497 family protein
MPINGIEWDDKKARLNLKTHKVSFETAQYVFSDTTGEVTMGIIKSTVKVGQKPSREEMKRIRAELKEAAKHPIVYTKNCPKSTPEALKEFAMKRAEMNRRKRRQTVTIRIQPEVLEKYKTLGRGYSGIMADVLMLAADNPEILLKASKTPIPR